MTDRLSQDERFSRFFSPLGKDVLCLVRFDGQERISECFEWRLQCLLNADEAEVDPSQIIGKPCHVELDTQDGSVRYYHGLCTEIRRKGWARDYVHYEVVLRPWLWLLNLQSQYEIFHEKSVKDIISQVFQDRGFSDFKFKLTKSYDAIPYCVHYGETVFNFVSRLMEKYGLFYYFDCTDSKHELVITDVPSNLPDVPGYGGLKFQPHTETGMREERLHTWAHENRLRTAKVDVDDYNYDKAKTKLEKTGEAKDSPKHGYADLKMYDFPTGYGEPGGGQTLADILVDMHRADAQRKYSRGYAPLLHAGGAFTLSDHPVEGENKKHFVVGAEHLIFQNYTEVRFTSRDLGEVVQEAPPSRSGTGTVSTQTPAEETVEGTFEVADADLAYKAPKRAVWPRVHGTQTAVVIKEKSSPADEEIDVDDQGRILVRFHWNDGKAESDKCSCRVRVAQIWAGSGWGGVWIPRVGMEVVVDFIEGDPDRPLVTGAVYNSANKPPIKFPDDKTQSTIKSQSSKGGTSSDNFNEIRFEDKKDDEEIYIHAERDRKMILEHDDDVEIGNDRNEKIGGSHTWELTGGDQKITLKGEPGTKDKYGKAITKKGHRTTTLEKGDETLDIKEGKRTTTIKMDDKRTITDGNDIHEIKKGNQTVTIDKGNQTTDIKMGNQTTTVKMGDQTTKISLGKGTTTAMKSFEIKVGGSSIKLDPMKVTIKAMQIEVKGSIKTDIKGLMTTVEGSAMLMLKGGLVKIN